VQTSWFSGDVYGTTTSGTRELQDLFEGKAVFDTPKPTSLIKAFLRMSTRDNDIILDFFAGSCSIAHAVFVQNREDSWKRNFICVQIREPVRTESLAYQEGYRFVSEIGKERIRRVASKLKKERKGQLNFHGNEDIGFRCLRLERSNYAEWPIVIERDTTQLELRFQQAETSLVEGWKPEHMLVEILLLQGFPLDSRIRPLPEFKRNDIKEVSSEFCQHRLYVCLDAKVHAETVAALHLRSEDILVCLDSALSDEAKITLSDGCNLKVI